MDEAEIKAKIKSLVDKYELVKQAGQLKSYTEEETKKDFILPLFEVLGWDVYNKKEVSAEEHIKSSGRVDYGFYLNGRAKFFLEAKKFSADLYTTEFAKQAIRYSWNRGVTWAVLTDFENLKIFNSQDIGESLATKQFFDIPCQQFVEKFDLLWLLSKEAFAKDLLDKKAEEIGKKLQRVPIGEKLYKDLNDCREILTQAFSLWNKDFSKDFIDQGVQKILDRLIFIRVVEDRGIEPPTLKPLLREWQGSKSKDSLFKYLLNKFKELDDYYNSNIFSRHAVDDWDEHDNALEEVISKLYGKEGYYEYDFKIIPADVLGAVYENYLGYKLAQSKKGITLDKDARKRKEQGIYYTPSYVVDYIVRNTLGPVLDKCTSIADLQKIKVLDPACGSGSFLLKALEVIHEKYKELGNQGGSFNKLQILVQNIYGVDLDSQAVELARLNLLINSLDEKMTLPSLSDNIKIGNSLISGTDEELKKYFGSNFRDKKPFDWPEEFPEIFAHGGFDCVIGNPPYISYYSKQAQTTEKTKSELDFLISRYDFIENKDKLGRFNTLMFFIERCIKNTKEGGNVGLIVDINLHSNPSIDIRKYISEKTQILKIIDEIKVFEDVGSSQVIFVMRNSKPLPSQKICWEHLEEKTFSFIKQDNQSLINKENQFSFKEGKDNIIQSVLAKLSNFPTLESIVGKNHIRTCITFTGKKDYFVKEQKNSKNNFPLLEGSGSLAFPYAPIIYKSYIDYDLKLRDKLNEEYRKKSIKENKRSPMVIGLGNLEHFKSPKVFIRLSDKRVTASYTKEIVTADLSLYILTLPNLSDRNSELSLFYLLGVLNSKVVTFYMKGLNLIRNLTTGTPQIRLNDIRQIPIPVSLARNELENLVGKMLSLNKELHEEPEHSEKWESLKSDIEKTDKKIDAEVYKLYGLTEEEIRVVETKLE